MITITLPLVWAKAIAVLLVSDMLLRVLAILANVLEWKIGRSE